MKLTKILSFLMMAMLSLSGMDFNEDKLLADPRPQLPQAKRTDFNGNTLSMSKSNELIFLIDDNSAFWAGDQWLDYFRTIYSYDDSSRLTMAVRQAFEDSIWQDWSKKIFFYDGSALPSLEEKWDFYDGVWKAIYQIQYQYNAQGEIIEELMRHWSDEAWMNYSRRLYFLNESGQLLEFRQDRWEDMAWRNWRRETLEYNEQNQHIRTTLMSWQDSVWLDVRNYLFSYGENGELTESIHQLWDDSLWTNNQRELYTYDNAQNLTEYLEQIWIDSVWKNLYQSLLEYTVLSKTVTEKDWVEESWENSARLFIEYDTHGRELTYQLEIWDFDTEDWVYYFKNENSYDRWGNQIELIYSKWDGSEWQYSDKTSWTWSPLYSWLQCLVFSNGDIETELFFGMHASASDAYDDILDQYAPPAPPAGEPDARFSILGEDYIRDVRSRSATSPVIWEISFDGNEETGLTFTWDNTAFPENGAFTLQKPDGTVILDMKESGSYTHSAGESKTLQIVYTFEPVSTVENVAARFRLFPNYPNPFNPQTTISWELPEAGPVQLTIYNISGQKIATLFNGTQEAGIHQVTFSANNLSAGVYFYQLKAGHKTQVQKMVYLK
ncbi:MAG TPA: T9SS type A sorting domain-containing protein [Candidatus Marinimicrobia bacterium]|nr:T9SS type A sorting domain-containing protein [Candidatus Neomarinimicrobiota bacterium]